MDSETSFAADPIFSLCERVISFHRHAWPPDENVIADEFVSFYTIEPFATPEVLAKLCENLRIKMSTAPLPKELRGHNCTFQNRRSIVISETQSFPGASEHTLFHEIREIFEYVFGELGFSTAQGEQLEIRAETFARLVRIRAVERKMPEFLNFTTQIESKWWRIAAFVLVGAATLFCAMTCGLLPHFEDAAEKQPRQ